MTTPPGGPGERPARPAGGQDEAVTEPTVREEERQRDDAGRGPEAEHAGWRTQARLFGGVAVFVAVIGGIYDLVADESAGVVLLALTAGLAALVAAYVGWPRRGPDDGGAHPAVEPGHDPHDGVWFPEASIWPLAIGAGMVLVGNGLLLGRWLLVPAGAFLLWALAGLVRQGRHRT